MENLKTRREISLEVSDRISGVLVGLVAGDRNGGPQDMALCLAQSLHESGRFEAQDVGRRYLDWWQRDGFDTGPVAGAVLELVDSGMSFERASSIVHEHSGGLTAGCNPAHRSAPLAMQFSIPDEQLPEIAKEEAALTHRHPLAGDVAAAVVSLCRALIRGADWEEALEVAAVGRMEETRGALRGSRRETLRNGGFAPDVLRAAVRFLSDSRSFTEAMQRAIEFAGPANYCPVLVGSIGGARWGRSAVPDKVLEHAKRPLTKKSATAII